MKSKMYLIDVSPFDIFLWGVDHGQLLMEQERDSEDWADAFQGHIISQKYCMPSEIAPRRQPHSDKWRSAKAKGFENIIDLMKRCN